MDLYVKEGFIPVFWNSYIKNWSDMDTLRESSNLVVLEMWLAF